MDNLLSEGDSSEESDNNQILLDWIKAALNFHAQYKDVTTIIDEQKTKRYFQIKSNRLMGQCPLESLVMLKLTMHTELERFVCDIDQLGWIQQPTSKQHFDKLREHTFVLNQLTKQAQFRLQLMTSSSS